uniref:Uncharacterized protein n=1 Tax=Sciurus vulgaris TaxID=55149 RepID=A0A8D2BDW0_SCIVU
MTLQEPGSAPPMSTVVSISREDITPDYVTWSLFNTIFLNFCCLGFTAFAFSIKSRDRKMVGDFTGSQTYASTSKKLNISATVISIIVIVLMLIFIRIRIQV